MPRYYSSSFLGQLWPKLNYSWFAKNRKTVLFSCLFIFLFVSLTFQMVTGYYYSSTPWWGKFSFFSKISISLERNYFVWMSSSHVCLLRDIRQSLYFLLCHSYLEFSNCQQSLHTDTDDLIRVSIAEHSGTSQHISVMLGYFIFILFLNCELASSLPSVSNKCGLKMEILLNDHQMA